MLQLVERLVQLAVCGQLVHLVPGVAQLLGHLVALPDSVALVLAHRPGSLRDALSAIADQGLNLRTIASRPAFDTPFTYRFYLEIEAVESVRLDAALAHIDGTARVLGSY